MRSLARYYKDKNNFDGVAMIRLVHDGVYEDYSRWSIDNNYMFFFDDSMKLGHIVFLTDSIKEYDTYILINPDNTKICLQLKLFYGGAIF